MFTKCYKPIVIRMCILILIAAMLLDSTLPAAAHAMRETPVTSPGTLDPSFDSDGKVTTDFDGKSNGASSIVVQPDGKILLAGGSNGDFALARYNGDGSLDPTFGTDGRVTTDFVSDDPLHAGDSARAAVLQPDGKIIAAGMAHSAGGFGVARYNSDGSLDASFDGDGRVVTAVNGDDYGSSLALQPDGKIVVAGMTTAGYISYNALIRYNPDGSLDTTFSGDGKLVMDFGGRGVYTTEIVLQPDGKILLASTTSSYEWEMDFALARYNSDGTLDASFGDGGKAITNIFNPNEYCRAVAPQPDGKIVVAGNAQVNGGSYALLARYNTDGTLDLSFGTDGKVVSDFGTTLANGSSVAIQPNGRILLGGDSWDANVLFVLERYNRDGSRDMTFGMEGRVSTVFGGNGQTRALAIQQDGKILQAGQSYLNGSNSDFVMVRYFGDETHTVTKTADTNDGVCDSDCSLREAIEAASADGTINFDASLSGQILMLGSALRIDKNLIIDGSSLSQNIQVDGTSAPGELMAIGSEHDPTVILRNVDFLNAAATAVLQYSGVLEISNSVFFGNITGIQSETQLAVTDSTFTENGTGIVNFGRLQVGQDVFSNNNRAIYNEKDLQLSRLGELTVTDSVFTQNHQGGIYHQGGVLSVLNSIFTGNEAEHGGAIRSGGMALIANSQFTDNVATRSGGAIANGGTLKVSASTFSGNTSAQHGGAIFQAGRAEVLESTFVDNVAGNWGGGIYVNFELQMINSTFDHNSAAQGGGIYFDPNINLTVSTFGNNTISGSTGGGLYVNKGSLRLFNNLLANSLTGPDCYVASTATLTGDHNLIELNAGLSNRCNVSATSADPILGRLGDNGGLTQTMALLPGSPAIDTGDNATCPSADQRGLVRPQDDYCDLGAYEAEGPVQLRIGDTVVNSYSIASGESRRATYAGMNTGPVKIVDTQGYTSLVAAERVIYKVNGVQTSFSEMMAFPDRQLDVTYWFPWYNNKDLDTQLRIVNMSSETASVHVYISGVEMHGSPFTLAAGESTRKSFPGVNGGPVKVTSRAHILASQRVIYKVNNVNTSFSEMMGLPARQLDTTYWLPWYNNKDLDTQLRIANVNNVPTSVRIYIRGQEMPGSPFTLGANASTRISFPNINAGPVQIKSTFQIVAAERALYKVNGVNTSFSEMMALPDNALDTTYWLPWYNNVDLDTQLRFANVGNGTATVHVLVGGVEMPGSPFTLEVGESTRQSFASINSGPVQIVSDQPIVAAERVIYKVNGVPTSFSEMMGLPDSLLDVTYWLPWYNNVDLDTQLRFGVP